MLTAIFVVLVVIALLMLIGANALGDIVAWLMLAAGFGFLMHLMLMMSAIDWLALVCVLTLGWCAVRTYLR